MDVLAELTAAVGEQKTVVESVLAKVRVELDACRSRCYELEQAILRTQAMLDPRASGNEPIGRRPRVTLHEAMRGVLRNAGEKGLTGKELRDAVVAGGLYLGRQGQPPSINQIHARARNYGQLFESRDGRFFLRPGS